MISVINYSKYQNTSMIRNNTYDKLIYQLVSITHQVPSKLLSIYLTMCHKHIAIYLTIQLDIARQKRLFIMYPYSTQTIFMV